MASIKYPVQPVVSVRLSPTWMIKLNLLLLLLLPMQLPPSPPPPPPLLLLGKTSYTYHAWRAEEDLPSSYNI
jgi:hypothetical protein